MNTYKKIEDVLKKFGRALAPHEFVGVIMSEDVDDGITRGLQHVGCTESTLARRLREMRQMGLVTAKRREGCSFVEYALAPCLTLFSVANEITGTTLHRCRLARGHAGIHAEGLVTAETVAA